MRKFQLIAVAAACTVFAGAKAQAAAMLVFDNGQLQNGYTLSPNAAVDPMMQHDGHATVHITPSGAYDQQGFVTPNDRGTFVPADATTFQFSVFVPLDTTSQNPDPNSVSNFSFQMGAPYYSSVQFGSSNSNQYTVDGAPGTIQFSRGVWHVVDLDLNAAFAQQNPGGNNVDPSQGDTTIFHLFTQADSAGTPIFLDEAGFATVPEPATLGILGLGSLIALRRNRSAAR